MALIGLYWSLEQSKYLNKYYDDTFAFMPWSLSCWYIGVVVLQNFLSSGVASFACFKLGLNLILCEKKISSQNWFFVTHFQRCNKNLRENVFFIFCNIFSTITYVNLQYRVCPSAILSGHILQKDKFHELENENYIKNIQTLPLFFSN